MRNFQSSSPLGGWTFIFLSMLRESILMFFCAYEQSSSSPFRPNYIENEYENVSRINFKAKTITIFCNKLQSVMVFFTVFIWKMNFRLQILLKFNISIFKIFESITIFIFIRKNRKNCHPKWKIDITSLLLVYTRDRLGLVAFLARHKVLTVEISNWNPLKWWNKVANIVLKMAL